jgi:hypothetical protein
MCSLPGILFNTCPTEAPTGSASNGPKSGDTMRYGDFRKFPGDKIEGHELLQNSKLDQMGQGRGSMKADNPALALSQQDHKAISRAQAKAGLHDRSKVGAMSPLQNVRENVKLVKKAEIVTRSQLAGAANAARKHAKKLK